MRLNDLFEKYLDDIDLTHQDTTIDSIKYRYNSHIKNKEVSRKQNCFLLESE